MAVTLIKGLIDVGPSGGSGSSSKVNPDKESRGGNAQSAPLAQTAMTRAASAPSVAAQTKLSTDAAVSVLRGRASGTEAKPLRDTREVDSLAFSVSERISSSRDAESTVHGGLSGEVARPHFQQ